MAAYKLKNRNGIWQIAFRHDGRTIQRTLNVPVDVGDKETNKANKLDATKKAAKLYHEHFSETHLGKYKHTWREAVKLYMQHRIEVFEVKEQEYADRPDVLDRLKKKHAKYKKEDLGKFDVIAEILKDKDIKKINETDLRNVRDLITKKRGNTHRTANRYIALISTTLNLCVKKLNDDNKSYWLDRLPNLPKTKEKGNKKVVLSREKYNELYAVLSPLYQDLMTVAIGTGLRGGNLRLMEKDWLYTKNGKAFIAIDGVDMKNNNDHSAPLSEEVVKAIMRSSERHPDSPYVFNTDRFGKPLHSISNNGWYAALKKVGLDKSLTFHDFRHIFAQNCVAAGYSDTVIMKLGGWKTASMVGNYSHTDPSNLVDFTTAADTYLRHGAKSELDTSRKPLLKVVKSLK